MNGIARLPYTFSTVIQTIAGISGTVINNGVVQDVNGNQWSLPASITIPLSGTINVSAECTTPGAIAAEPGDIEIISTPVAGWQSTTNSDAAIQGAPVEPDSSLRGRQTISVSLPSETPVAGTVAAIAAIPGVIRYLVKENPTNAVDADGNPPHSIIRSSFRPILLSLKIATAIYDKDRSVAIRTERRRSTSPIRIPDMST